MGSPPEEGAQQIAKLERKVEALRGLLSDMAADKSTLEKALLEQQRRHLDLVGRVPWIVVRIDALLRYSDVNRTFAQIYPETAALDHKVGECGEDPAWSSAVLEFCEDRSHKTREVEVQLTLQGEIRTFVLNLFRGDLEDHVTILGLDHSERLQALTKAEEAAARADRASQAKSDFLAVMSHEIRTPMTGVLGMLDLLGDTHLDDSQREIVETIEGSGQALLKVVNEVLDLTKIEAGGVEFEEIPFQPREVVEGAVRLFAAEAAKSGLYLGALIAPKLPKVVVGDPGRLRQVLTNLIGNALKFTQAGGVTIVGEARAQDEGWRLWFSVQDTGIGMTPDQLQRVFSPFTQAEASTSRQFGGTGLGLVIAKQLVEGMGGGMEVQSEPGKGSSFRFCIPFREASSGQSAEASSTVQDYSGLRFRGRVLVAEDNLVNQRIAVRFLERFGCHVSLASDGAEAWNLAEQDDSIDLVFMDVNMPIMDGFEATQKIRGLSGRMATVPVVAMTANAIDGDRVQCIEAGMNDYLGKPYTAKQLAEILLRWMPHRRAAG